MGNLLDEYMRQVEREGLKNGITFNETVKNSTSDVELDEQTFVNNIEREGMMSDTMFKMFESKFNMDWEHVKEVADLAEAKEYLKKQLMEEENENVKRHKEKIREMALKLREEASKLK